MNEAQRFLRYITPGLVFLAQALLLLLILLPQWTTAQIRAVKGDEAVGVVIATVLASGGVGFIFSVLHHVVHWSLGAPALDHSGLVSRLRGANIILLLDAKTGDPLSGDVQLSRADAWVVVTSLWHERLGTSQQIKGADPGANVLSDMIHTTGTARVASAVAWLAALVIAAHVARLSLQTEPVVRFIVANVLGGLLTFMHHRNCLRVGQLAQGVIEQVLHDALAMEKDAPVRTHVVLKGKRHAETRGREPGTLSASRLRAQGRDGEADAEDNEPSPCIG